MNKEKPRASEVFVPVEKAMKKARAALARGDLAECDKWADIAQNRLRATEDMLLDMAVTTAVPN